MTKTKSTLDPTLNPLPPFFEVEFKERAMSTSMKKGGTENNAQILEATFVNFFWLGQSGNEVRAKSVKMITYPQYPESSYVRIPVHRRHYARIHVSRFHKGTSKPPAISGNGTQRSR